MTGKLIDIPTGALFEKFGAGNHKPGSGSASALQGMLSAQLLRTVIDLTCDPKREKGYHACIPEMLRIKREIDTRIYNRLQSLFEEDSKQFDQVIKLRIARNREKDPQKQRELSIMARELLKTSTELPIEIAKLCLELVEFAFYIFDNGFKSARGDSGTALSGAIASVSSCLYIVYLNLVSLPVDARTEKIWQDEAYISEHYQTLLKKAASKLNALEIESNEYRTFNQRLVKFRKGELADSIRSDADIEKIARELQNILWVEQEKIWKNQEISHPIQLLKPDVVLKKVLEYTYSEPDTLGSFLQGNDRFVIAGLIDKNKKSVQVSKQFPKETRLFTAAHELGHAIFHKQTVLHRDKPLDGPASGPRNLEEMQADKFAAYFLTPTNQVKEFFEEIFQIPKFVINESNVLAIRAGSITGLRNKCQNLRGLSRLIASTDYYAGKSFNSLAQIFRVSVETMAIRLEELGLVEF